MSDNLLTTIMIYVAASGAITKLLVDVFRAGTTINGWLTRLMSFGIGIGVVFAILLANSVEITPQTAAQAVLAGLISGAGAIGITEVQNAVNGVRAVRTVNNLNRLRGKQ